MNHSRVQRFIDGQRAEMIRLVQEWSDINSGSFHIEGLARMRDRLLEDFAVLEVPPRLFDLPPATIVDERGRDVPRPLGQCISWRGNPDAPFQVLLAIHYDTVFPAEHPFQKTRWRDAATLRGPGVVDAKSGIAIIRTIARALGQSPLGDRIGWEIFLNSDEEVGSPGSAPLLHERASRYDLGLLFEPALPDGSLVGARKGAGGFTIVIHGRAAHVGREFAAGRSAIHRAARLVTELETLNADPRLTVNVGRIDGGGPTNVVADLAVVRFNIRAEDGEALGYTRAKLNELVEVIDGEDGFRARLHGDFSSPPKPFENGTAELFEAIAGCAAEQGVRLRHKPTGGVCDGNKLAGAGLPNIDTLGGRGGGAHSDHEFLVVDSLTERARLVTSLLLGIAAGEIPWRWGRASRN